VQLHLFIFVLLLSAAVSVMLQPHAWAGQMDLLSMSSIAFLMFMSLYFIGYSKQPSGAGSRGSDEVVDAKRMYGCHAADCPRGSMAPRHACQSTCSLLQTPAAALCAPDGKGFGV
jgi:hypothetical protein